LKQCHRRQQWQAVAVYGAFNAMLLGGIQHQRDNAISTEQGNHCLKAVAAFHLGAKQFPQGVGIH
jgi:hypothetical protein